MTVFSPGSSLSKVTLKYCHGAIRVRVYKCHCLGVAYKDVVYTPDVGHMSRFIRSGWFPVNNVRMCLSIVGLSYTYKYPLVELYM